MVVFHRFYAIFMVGVGVVRHRNTAYNPQKEQNMNPLVPAGDVANSARSRFCLCVLGVYGVA